MPYFILAIAAISLLLIGCSFGGSFKDRQARARGAISSVATKLKETTEELQKKAEQLQQGVEKVAGAVKAGQEGIEQAKEALNVSGTEKKSE